MPIEVIPLHGSVELGPITGMSEAIVDLVSTDNTLRENNLEEIEILFQSTVRLIAHPISYRANRHNIANLVQKIEKNL